MADALLTRASLLARLSDPKDREAWRQFVDLYGSLIYGFARRRSLQDADAADLTQEVFVRAYRALPRLQTPEAFTSWLYRIAVNLSRNWLRDRGRVRRRATAAPALPSS